VSHQRIDVEAVGDVTVVRFRVKALGESQIEAVREELFGLAGRPRLRLDLAGIEYLGAAALSVFVSLHRRVRAAGGELTLTNFGPIVGEIFDVTRLTGLFSLGEPGQHG
jgi:anti-anti-sigma factor